jgi:hypothetical protein
MVALNLRLALFQLTPTYPDVFVYFFRRFDTGSQPFSSLDSA